MYFPYLRGKQFELIALRELSNLIFHNRNKLSPIIEPVKDSSTLTSALSELAKKEINFTIIVNPKVGDLKGKPELVLKILNKSLKHYRNYQVGLIIDKSSTHLALLKTISDNKIDIPRFTLIHEIEVPDPTALIADFESVAPVRFNVIHFGKTSRRYYRKFSIDTIIELEDYFEGQSKNADYLSIGESKFSEEHIYFSDEGFVGFSDFLTIGDNYSESGFLPYAVAIHISYLRHDDVIFIKHLVSDSNSDTADIGGKFAEALDKLINWAHANKVTSEAMKEFEDLHSRGHFPGLGSLKKLSIKHHIETVLSYL